MWLMERRPRCAPSAARLHHPHVFLRPALLVAIDSRLSNAPAAASSYIIRRLRRIEITSIRAPQVGDPDAGEALLGEGIITRTSVRFE